MCVSVWNNVLNLILISINWFVYKFKKTTA